MEPIGDIAKVAKNLRLGQPLPRLRPNTITLLKEHTIKPSYKIYQILLDRYHLIADESLFIDDSLANIVIAQDIGIHGIHFKFGTNLKQELKNIGVL